jgi:methionine synthase II (cobalamin-independent)
VPTISGFGRLRTVARAEAEQLVGRVLAAVDVATVVHCCASAVPSALIRSVGADAVSLDVARLDGSGLDELAGAVDAGLDVWAGVIPATAPEQRLTDTDVADRVARLWRRLDQDPAAMARRTVITPVCGLAGADVAWARPAYTLARAAARAFADVAGRD